MEIRAFVQARMSSSRFPGKVLAPMLGVPLIRHVLDRAAMAVGSSNVVLCTSTHTSDDPLALYAAHLGYAVHRGSLDNTVLRLQEAARSFPCDAFFRVCGDSPLLDPGLLARARQHFAPGVDMVTNVHPRSYPKGHSVELVRAATYLAIDVNALDEQEREHATTYIYRNAERYALSNLRAPEDRSGEEGYAVDTIGDMRRLEALVAAQGFPKAV